MCKKHNEYALMHKNAEVNLCILHIDVSKAGRYLAEIGALIYIY